MKNDDLINQAKKIIDSIAFTPFQECLSISRDFKTIPSQPGIYAIIHQKEGLLYIGKTQNLRRRFQGGHKAFLWAWLDKYEDEEVGIVVEIIPYWQNPELLLELEAIILRTTEPPYNVKIPPEK